MWQAVDLGPNQWYMFRADFADRAEKRISWCAWVRVGEVIFPPQYFDDASPNDRSFRWSVQLMQAESAFPDTCEAAAQPLSERSPQRTFFWY